MPLIRSCFASIPSFHHHPICRPAVEETTKSCGQKGQRSKPVAKARTRSLFLVAINGNDAAAVAALYTEDAILVPDTGPVYGREKYARYLAQ